MFTLIVLIGAIVFFVTEYKRQRANGIPFDNVDVFHSKWGLEHKTDEEA